MIKINTEIQFDKILVFVEAAGVYQKSKVFEGINRFKDASDFVDKHIKKYAKFMEDLYEDVKKDGN